MQISNDTVVAIDYVLTDDQGLVLDSSEGREPLVYLHGAGRIIPGLEQQLDGRRAGDELQITIAPEDGYGERNESLRQEVSLDFFADVEDLKPGMRFRVDSNAGPILVAVVDIGTDVVTIDGNHPLAGVNLNFAVTVREVRAATDEEIAHGHAHGPDGHAH